jgi:hypothetical protein
MLQHASAMLSFRAPPTQFKHLDPVACSIPTCPLLESGQLPKIIKIKRKFTYKQAHNPEPILTKWGNYKIITDVNKSNFQPKIEGQIGDLIFKITIAIYFYNNSP